MLLPAIIPYREGVGGVFPPYIKNERQMSKLFTIFFMSWSIIFISSIGFTGIPLKEGMTPQQVKAQIEEMKHQRKKMLREFGEEQQKKEEESVKREQLIKASQPPTPTPAEEKRAVEEKQAKKETGEEKDITRQASPAPTGELGKGLVPGVITPEQEGEEAKKIEKQEKVEKEYKSQRNFSFILMLIVMVTTIVLLIKSMSKGKTKDEEKKK